MPELPVTRAVDNPWPEFPKVLKRDYGQREAEKLYGQDPRQYLISTQKFIGNAQGEVTGVQVTGIEWQKGSRVPVEVEGSQHVLDADLVLLAVGFTGPEEAMLSEMGIPSKVVSQASSSEPSHTTDIPGIFIAGDMRRGQSLVVWAIHEGRQAAYEVDCYLMGSSQLAR
ncbi:Glutamate synthase [NADPH] small chain [compost metagenome]